MFEVPMTESEVVSSVQPHPFFSGKMPLPPSVNAAYQIIRTFQGSRVSGMRIGPTPALDQFKHDAALVLSQGFHDWSVINAIRDSRRKVPLSVHLAVYLPTEWKRDLDGVFKYAIDAAFEHLHMNDNQVVKMDAEKLVDPFESRIEIDIRCVVR